MEPEVTLFTVLTYFKSAKLVRSPWTLRTSKFLYTSEEAIFVNQTRLEKCSDLFIALKVDSTN